MSGLDIFYAFLELLGGIGVFLFGMKLMGDSLETAAGGNIKKMFRKISDKKMIGLGIGTATTAVVQSSAAVIVMATGFVNSGLMTLNQAVPIIYGANIGTTVTALIVALGVGGVANVNLTIIFASLAGAGALSAMFIKKDRGKKIANVVTGLGMIFVGLFVMTSSMDVFSDSGEIRDLILKVSNPFLLILFGVLFTALIQSSSAFSGIVITMAASHLIGFEHALYLMLGSNVGTCVTPLIAAIGTSANAKRTAVANVIIKITGVVLFGLASIIRAGDVSIFTAMFAGITNPAMQVALLHLFFNCVTTIVFFPFTGLLVRLVTKIVRDRSTGSGDEPRLFFLEDMLLRTPSLAVVQLKNEIANMAGIAKKNFDCSMDAVLRGKVSDVLEDLRKNENELNFLNREITKYLVKLTAQDLTEKDGKMVATTYHSVGDLERIGDYAENISEYAERMENEELVFSDEAKAEIRTLWETIDSLYENVMKTYESETLDFIDDVNHYEDIVDRLKEEMGANHIERLAKGTCSPEVGVVYLSLSSDAERVADHMTNVAYAVRSYSKKPKEQK